MTTEYFAHLQHAAVDGFRASSLMDQKTAAPRQGLSPRCLPKERGWLQSSLSSLSFERFRRLAARLRPVCRSYSVRGGSSNDSSELAPILGMKKDKES